MMMMMMMNDNEYWGFMMTTKITVFWDMTPCSLVDPYPLLGET
jgi:hypothetical protein